MRILFAMQDPGGCQALIPVINVSGKQIVCCLAAGASSEMLEKLKIGHIPFPDYQITQEHVAKACSDFRPDRIVTATSFNLSLDKLTIAYAQKNRVRCISIVDYWSNYWVRFEHAGVTYMPDLICVTDQLMKDEMVRDGFDAKRIVITGNPRFDSYEPRRGIAAGTTVLFLSQPFSELQQSLVIGYDEHDTIARLIAALDKLADIHATLVIRPHPKEDPQKFLPFLAHKTPSLSVSLDRNLDLQSSIADARVVVGMSSMALFEAALAGKEVISFQPHMQQEFCILSKLGIIKTITDTEQLVPQLDAVFKGKTHAGMNMKLLKSYIGGRATKKVFALVTK